MSTANSEVSLLVPTDDGDVGFSLGAINPFPGGAGYEGTDVSMDDFAIFRGELSQAQIQSIMANGIAAPAEPMMLIVR